LDRGLAEGTLAEATQLRSKNENVADKIRIIYQYQNVPGADNGQNFPNAEDHI
jgi:hypothetical protein